MLELEYCGFARIIREVNVGIRLCLFPFSEICINVHFEGMTAAHPGY